MSTTAPAAPPPPPPPAFGKQPVKKFQPAEGPTDRDALMADIRNGPRLRSVAKPKEKKLFLDDYNNNDDGNKNVLSPLVVQDDPRRNPLTNELQAELTSTLKKRKQANTNGVTIDDSVDQTAELIASNKAGIRTFDPNILNTHKPQPTGFKIGHAVPNFKVKSKEEVAAIETKMEQNKMNGVEKVVHPVLNGTLPRKSSTSSSEPDSRKESVSIVPWRTETDDNTKDSTPARLEKEPIDGIILREDRRTSSRPTLLFMGSSREEKPLEVDTTDRASIGRGISVEALSPRSEICFKIEPATSPMTADVKKMNNFFERQISASKTLPLNHAKKTDKFSTLPTMKKTIAPAKKTEAQIAQQSEIVTKPLAELHNDNDGVDPTTQVDVRKLMFTAQAHPEPIDIYGNQDNKMKQNFKLFSTPTSPVVSHNEQKSPPTARSEVKKLAQRLNSQDSATPSTVNGSSPSRQLSNTLPRQQDLSRQSSSSSTTSNGVGAKSLPPTGLKIGHPKASFSVNKSQTLPRQLSSGGTTIFKSTEMLNQKPVTSPDQSRKVSSIEITLTAKPPLSAQSSVQSDVASSVSSSRTPLSPQSSINSSVSKTPSPQPTIKIIKNSVTTQDSEVQIQEPTTPSMTKSVQDKEVSKPMPIKIKSSLHSSTKRPAPLPPPLSPKPTPEELASRSPLSPQPSGFLMRKKSPAPPPPVRASSLHSKKAVSPLPPPPTASTTTSKPITNGPSSRNNSSLFSTFKTNNNNTLDDSGVDVNFDAKEHVSFSKEMANAPNNYKDVVKTSEKVLKTEDVYFNDVSLRNIKLDIDPDRNSIVRIVKQK